MRHLFSYKRYFDKLVEARQLTKKCKLCKANFTVPYNKRHQETCSKSCAMKYNWEQQEYRKNITEKSKETAYQKHKDPDVEFGWKIRPKDYMSKPEKIAHAFLTKNKIKFKREHRVGKFYIDFAIMDKKLAIEIDGLQHRKEKRAKLDKVKDKVLIKDGWTVHRIKVWEDDIEAALSNLFL